MDPDRLWKDLKDELRALRKSPNNRDLRLHVHSLLTALATWIYQNGSPPELAEENCEQQNMGIPLI